MLCDQSSPGNANALNALDRHARSSPAVEHIRTRAHARSPHRPFSSVILLRCHWLPPLPSVRPLPARAACQRSAHHLRRPSLAGSAAADADALLFKRQSRLSRPRRSLLLSRLSPPATPPQPADISLSLFLTPSLPRHRHSPPVNQPSSPSLFLFFRPSHAHPPSPALIPIPVVFFSFPFSNPPFLTVLSRQHCLSVLSLTFTRLPPPLPLTFH